MKSSMNNLALKIQYELLNKKFIYTTVPFEDSPDGEFISRNIMSDEIDAVNLTIDREGKDFDFWTADFGRASEDELIPHFYMSFRDMFTTSIYGWNFLVVGLDREGKTVSLTENEVSYIMEELRIWS